MSIDLEGVFMMANFSTGCLRGSTKPTSESRNDAHLSITFFAGRSRADFQIFPGRSQMYLQKLFGRSQNDFQISSGTSYVQFQLFSKREKCVRGTHSLIVFEQLLFQNSYPFI